MRHHFVLPSIVFGLSIGLCAAASAVADDVKVEPKQEESSVWAADFDKAAAQAKKEGKDLLVDFTGSDWCGWCKRLDAEVFSHDEFLSAARKQYVLLALDYPRDPAVKAKVPNPARNEELQRKYGIHSFPTVLLMTPDGDVFGQTGYANAPDGPEAYVKGLAKLRDEGMPELTAAIDAAKAIEAAAGDAKAALAEKAIEALTSLPQDSDKKSMRAKPVKAAVAADPDNKAGFGAKAVKALFAAGAADDAVMDAAEKLDPKNEQGILEQVVAAKMGRLAKIEDLKDWVKICDDLFALGTPKDKKLAKTLAVNCMFFNYQHLKDLDKAKVYAKLVQGMGYEAKEERVKQLVEKILGEGEAKKAPDAK